VSAPTETQVGVYRGFIQPVGASERDIAAGLRESRSHRLYTDVRVPVQFADEIEQDGIRFRATFVTQTTGISSVDHHKEVDLEYV